MINHIYLKVYYWPQEVFKYLGVSVPVSKNEDSFKTLLELNFSSVFDKMKTILNLWASRNLSLIGRITIIKSLIVPQITYKAAMLPVMLPKNLLQKFNKLFFRFIWGSNWERVSRNVLCGNIESGGVNMIHLESYLIALHAKNVSLLFDDTFCSPWKFIELLFINRNLLGAILFSNIKINTKPIKKLLPLRSMYVSFAILFKFSDDNTNDNSETFLWLNRFLKYKNKPLYNEEFANAGIVDAKQLVDSNGNFKSYDNLAIEYNLNPNNASFIEHVKLVSAIPDNWQLNSAYINRRGEFIDKILENLKSHGKTTKSFYCFLFSKLPSIPVKQQARWNQALNILPEDIDWSSIYKRNFASSPETKLRSFQTKLNLRAIVTNIALHGFEIADTDKCFFCNLECETLLHLFCTCSKLEIFWENVTSWIESKLKVKFDLNPLIMLFGVEECNQFSATINCILLNVRFIIFRCKIEKLMPDMHMFYRTIKNAKLIEKRIAEKNDKMIQFEKKWSNIV